MIFLRKCLQEFKYWRKHPRFYFLTYLLGHLHKLNSSFENWLKKREAVILDDKYFLVAQVDLNKKTFQVEQ